MDRRALLFGGAGTIAAAAGAWKLGVETGTAQSAHPARTPPVADPALGINLTPISYWNPVAFIDRLKASSPWGASGKPVPADPRGYPLGMNGQPSIGAMLPCEAGQYILLHDGDIDVRLQGGKQTSAKPGRVEFEARDAFAGGRMLIITAMRRLPTFMHFVRRQDEATFAAGEMFAPEFLAQIQGFDTLRFMDWLRTNGSQVIENFTSADSLSFANGVPLEVALMLANKIGAHPWICLPHLASDALVARTVATLKASRGLAPWLEYSNEVWNQGFEQARHADRQAKALWGAGASGAIFYGYRAGQIGIAARGSGVRMVLGTQTVVPARASGVWDGVARAGAVDRDFAGWIVAAYVSGTLTQAVGPTLGLASRNDVAGGIDNLLHADTPGAMSVATMAKVYAEQGNIAAAHGLRLLAYEANVHLNTLPVFAAQKAQVGAFMQAIVASPASARVLEANLEAFGAAGGDLACLFNLSSAPGDYGDFGLVGSGSWGAIRRRLAGRERAGSGSVR